MEVISRFLCRKYIAILVGLLCPPHAIWYRSLTVRKFARILKFSSLHIKVGKKLGIYMGINVWVVGKLFRVRSVFKSCGSFVPPPPMLIRVNVQELSNDNSSCWFNGQYMSIGKMIENINVKNFQLFYSFLKQCICHKNIVPSW